ncbi:MAG: DUF1684 domain-containing protein [Bacteroidetes bacterium]|nr:DUF1684 domain-containing protein [Bacteroidota bacterium]
MARLWILICLSMGISSCGQTGERNSHSDWQKGIEEMRKAKDNAFAFGPESPIEDSEHFHGLKYYTPDENYRVEAILRTENAEKVRQIPDTKGGVRNMGKAGILQFELQGRLCKLPAFVAEEDSLHFFIMFRDATNGNETYSGGRFIEAERFEKTGMIDFNMAYNPYCHYNHDFSCPVVPDDCKLNIPVKAGEKIFR